MVGDFNLQNTNINPMCTKSDASGQIIEELLNEEYMLLNNDHQTHEKGSILDLHLCSMQLAKHFAKFETFEETLSDHYMTISEFNLRAPKSRSLRTNWKCFREKVSYYKSQYADLNNRAESIATYIKMSYENSLKEVKPIRNKELVAFTRKKTPAAEKSQKAEKIGPERILGGAIPHIRAQLNIEKTLRNTSRRKTGPRTIDCGQLEFN